MNFSSPKYLIHLLLLAIVGAIAASATTFSLISAPLYAIVIDGVMSGIIAAVLIVALRFIVMLANNMVHDSAVGYIYFAALGMLFTIGWLGAEALSITIFLPVDIAQRFTPLLPVRALIAVLSYGFASFYYKYINLVQTNEEDMSLADTEELSNSNDTLIEQGLNPEQKPEIIEHIAIKNGQKIDLVLTPDIFAICAEGDYVMIYTSRGRHLKEQTMKYFEHHLPPGKFVRIHRSTIVNIDFISRIESYEKQGQLITLTNGQQVRASASGYKEIKKVLSV